MAVRFLSWALPCTACTGSQASDLVRKSRPPPPSPPLPTFPPPPPHRLIIGVVRISHRASQREAASPTAHAPHTGRLAECLIGVPHTSEDNLQQDGKAQSPVRPDCRGVPRWAKDLAFPKKPHLNGLSRAGKEGLEPVSVPSTPTRQDFQNLLPGRPAGNISTQACSSQ